MPGQIWKRWDWEPEVWYSRFLFFAQQEPHWWLGRSLIRAYREYRGGDRIGPTGKRVKPPGRWSRQAKRFEWRKRAEAWDRYKEEQASQALLAKSQRVIFEQDREQVIRGLWDRQPDENKHRGFEHFRDNCIAIDAVYREYRAKGVELSSDEVAAEIVARRKEAEDQRVVRT
jgi:hypothetical protein